jgi:predicted metal-dependent TIM-barrel fold hydrolase
MAISKTKDSGVGTKSVARELCRTRKQAMKVGDDIELELARELHIPVVLATARRRGSKVVLPQLESIAEAGDVEA